MLPQVDGQAAESDQGEEVDREAAVLWVITWEESLEGGLKGPEEIVAVRYLLVRA